MEPFCSNEACMFHMVEVEPHQTILELEVNDDTPLILLDVHKQNFTQRSSLVSNGKVLAKLCLTCQSAVNLVHEIDKRVI